MSAARAQGGRDHQRAVAAEAELVMGLEPRARRPTGHGRDPPDGDRASRRARSAPGRSSGPTSTIGEHVTIGRDCRIGASCVIDGVTEIGDGNEIFPMTSIGLVPQDLKFGGEPTRVRHRRPQRDPRVRDHPSRHGGRRRRSPASATTTC